MVIPRSSVRSLVFGCFRMPGVWVRLVFISLTLTHPNTVHLSESFRQWCARGILGLRYHSHHRGYRNICYTHLSPMTGILFFYSSGNIFKLIEMEIIGLIILWSKPIYSILIIFCFSLIAHQLFLKLSINLQLLVH